MTPVQEDYTGTAARAAVVTGIAAGVLLLIWLLLTAAHIWLLVFAGLLLAVLLSAAADGLRRVTGMPRGLAVLLALTLFVGAVAGLVWLLWPSLSEQTNQLARELPAAIAELRRWVESQEWGRWLLGSTDAAAIGNGVALDQATNVVMQTIGGVGSLVVILFVGIYVAADPGLYHRGVRRLFPERRRAQLDTVIFDIASVLRWWLVGKLLAMTVVGVLSTVGLWWLNVPLALTFGLLAALLTFIPNFGPILSVVPPALLALVEDPGKALSVVILYLVIQTVESYAIEPLIQRRTVSMPPALTITAQVVLGVLVGVIGIAVATPLVAALMSAIRMTYVEGTLEGDPPRTGEARPEA